jgi:2'-5' RNA ligase
MKNLAIVAIPAEDDYVNRISSEKVPHMTLLFLGEADKVKNFNNILGFVQHAANQSLMRFGMEVDRRGVLGPEEADVLFFSKSRWSGFEEINKFRSYLLKNDNIRIAYDSTEQFPEWMPHLTLGYPKSPAKPDERDYPGISYVSFDRIAVWFEDYEGVEFPLKAYDWYSESEVAMGMNPAKRVVENVLAHFGVRGMKWGVRRKATVGPQEVIVRDSRVTGRGLRTSGGAGHPATKSAVRAREIGQIGKKSGLKALSDEDLQTYVKRIQLEQSVRRLQYSEKSRAQRFVATLLGQTGKNTAQNVANDASSAAVKKGLIKAGILAAAA